jgi:hypothetical protein
VLALATFVLLMALTSSGHTLAMLLAGLACGAPAEEVSLFFGPRLLSFRLGGLTCRLGCLPLGGYVKFHDDDLGPLRRRYRDLHPLTRAAIPLAGCAALLLVAMACLGPAEGWGSFLRGFGQFPAGALAPLSTGQELQARLAEVLTALPLAAALGVFAAKVAAVNLLPLPPLNGGQVLATLLRWRRPPGSRLETAANYAGLLIYLALCLGWLTALAVYLYRGPQAVDARRQGAPGRGGPNEASCHRCCPPFRRPWGRFCRPARQGAVGGSPPSWPGGAVRGRPRPRTPSPPRRRRCSASGPPSAPPLSSRTAPPARGASSAALTIACSSRSSGHRLGRW